MGGAFWTIFRHQNALKFPSWGGISLKFAVGSVTVWLWSVSPDYSPAVPPEYPVNHQWLHPLFISYGSQGPKLTLKVSHSAARNVHLLWSNSI